MSTPSPNSGSKASFADLPADFPSSITILVTNESGSGISPVSINLPGSGTLWVGYEYQDQPAASVVLWHQGGQTETIPPGFNTFNSQAGDAIEYSLAYEGQSIKLGWGYEN